MIYAIIDFGSNTLRLSIYEVDPKDPYGFVNLLNKKTMAGLASYLDEEGNLREEGIDKAIEILKSYQRRIANFDVAGTDIVATAVLRKANNVERVKKRIKKETGLDVNVIPGIDEARYGFLGAMATQELSEGCLIDIGGASTELVVFKGDKIENAYSLPFGSLSLYLDHVSGLIPTPKEIDTIRERVSAELKTLEDIQGKKFKILSGVGGSVRAAGKLRDDWFHEETRRSITDVSAEEIERIFGIVNYDPHGAMRKVLMVVPDRVHTAIPGIVCADTIRDFFGSHSIRICKYGVREGYLLGKVLGLDEKSAYRLRKGE